MMSDVDVPAVGHVDSKWVVAGVSVVGGIVAVAWWRRRQSAAAPVVADPTTGTDSTNPTYRNPNPVVTTGGDGAELPPTTDPEWSQRVLNKLNWMEPSYLGDILGKYLGRQPLSIEEAAVIRAAWAIQGKPPSGMPIILSTSSSTPGTGGGGGTTPPAPSVPSAPTGLHVTSNYQAGPSNAHVTVAWSTVSDATSYVVSMDDPYNLGQQRQDVAGNSVTFADIQALDSNIRVNVQAKNESGTSPVASITVHTAGRFVGQRPPAKNTI